MYVAMVLRSHVCIIDKLLVVGVHFFLALGIGCQLLVFYVHMQLHVLGNMCCICDFDVFIGAAACGHRKALVTHEDIMQSGLACLMIVPVHGW